MQYIETSPGRSCSGCLYCSSNLLLLVVFRCTNSSTSQVLYFGLVTKFWLIFQNFVFFAKTTSGSHCIMLEIVIFIRCCFFDYSGVFFMFSVDFGLLFFSVFFLFFCLWFFHFYSFSRFYIYYFPLVISLKDEILWEPQWTEI